MELDDRYGRQYKGEYVFGPISWGQMNRITSECTKIHPVTRTSVVDIKTLNARVLLATLKEHPKCITLGHLLDESVNGLPSALGEILMAAADKVNGYTARDRDEVKKLKERWGLE